MISNSRVDARKIPHTAKGMRNFYIRLTVQIGNIGCIWVQAGKTVARCNFSEK